MANTPRLLTVLLLSTALLSVALAHGGDGGWNQGGHHHHHHDDNNKCRPCNSCKQNDNWCFSNCKRDCGQAQEQGINIERCKGFGNDAGVKSAQQACETTMLYCKGGQRSFGAPQRNKVSLEQCGNAAYGVCQNKARDRNSSPCGNAFNGINQCSKDAFWTFYGNEVDWWCNQAVAPFDKKN